MKTSTRLLTFCALTCLACLALADDIDDVAAAVDKVLETVSSTDPDDMRALMLEEAGLLAMRKDPDNPDGPMRLTIRSRDEALAMASPENPEFIERWLDPPHINLHGPIASVWGKYEFLIDGQRSHCGITNMEFVLVDERWMLSHWSYTAEPDGCPPR